MIVLIRRSDHAGLLGVRRRVPPRRPFGLFVHWSVGGALWETRAGAGPPPAAVFRPLARTPPAAVFRPLARTPPAGGTRK